MDNQVSIGTLVSKASAAVATPKQKSDVMTLHGRIGELCRGQNTAVVTMALLLLVMEDTNADR